MGLKRFAKQELELEKLFIKEFILISCYQIKEMDELGYIQILKQ